MVTLNGLWVLRKSSKLKLDWVYLIRESKQWHMKLSPWWYERFKISICVHSAHFSLCQKQTGRAPPRPSLVHGCTFLIMGPDAHSNLFWLWEAGFTQHQEFCCSEPLNAKMIADASQVPTCQSVSFLHGAHQNISYRHPRNHCPHVDHCDQRIYRDWRVHLAFNNQKMRFSKNSDY